ncbi:MAG TPA: hypothetical protein VFT85_01970 [Acidimicrobiia bacterium]|nr:hypothetical protein [Acidimicrobiia bacterium]
MSNYHLRFVERLTGHDLEMLASLDQAPAGAGELRAILAREPGTVDLLLADQSLYESLFEDAPSAMIPGVTPLLAFGVLVHRTKSDLASATYVPEWIGAGERLPVFDAASIREFIEDSARPYLIAELLTSFTKVASGATWVRTERGYRKRRYSELDPVALAEMVESLPMTRRSSGYRRLGEVSLFLTGVFPDHTARHPTSPMQRARLARLSGIEAADAGDLDYVHFLERVGRSWYDRAASDPLLPTGLHGVLCDMAENFPRARRFLNYLTDRYLHRVDTGLMNPVG